MKSRELDLGAAAPVESHTDRTVDANSFDADVFVVEWQVAGEPPRRAPGLDRWWRNEAGPLGLDGA